MEKPEAKSLRERGFPFVISDLTEPVDELAEKLKGFDTVISAIDAGGLMIQLSLSTSITTQLLLSGFESVNDPCSRRIGKGWSETVHPMLLRHHMSAGRSHAVA